MFSQLRDGDQIRVSPSVLINMALGGNIRRKRTKFEELKQSVKDKGIIQPVVARPILGNEGQLELLAGYGRLDAALSLNLADMPVLIRLVDDKTALEIHLAENMAREEISLVDEVEFAKRYISLHHGDRQSAAKALGWDLSKLNSRLELLTCTDAVLEALADGKIKAGHALCLSVFNEKVQNNTLEKIFTEKLSVKDLKARANQVQIPLSIAKFDLTECNTCQFNTSRQSGLFDMGAVEAKCSNNKCFQDKNKAHIAVIKEQAEERFGKVLLLSETVRSDVNTVTAAVVGESQFVGGCGTCASRVALMDDSITGSAGRIMQSQCIDTTCFKNCVNAHNAETVATNNSVKDDKKPKGTSDKTETESKGKGKTEVGNVAVKGKLSQPAIDAHKAEIRVAAGIHLLNNTTFNLAIQVIAMIKFTGFKLISNTETSVAKLMTKSNEELEKMLVIISEYAAKEAKSFGNGTDNASELLTNCACATSDGAVVLKNGWTPTKAVLEKYTSIQLIFIAEQSGFSDAIEQHDPKGWEKLKKGRKDVLLESLLKFPFNWSHYAPQGYLDLMPR